MSLKTCDLKPRQVALLAEGVDRNSLCFAVVCYCAGVALLAEGVDRNKGRPPPIHQVAQSPSSRRAWIEMVARSQPRTAPQSPSSRRAWIEMVARSQPRTAPQSPSSRRAWIEIQKVLKNTAMLSVALLAEGVDRNDQMQPLARWVMTSPSSRRAWIEMIWTCKLTLAKKSPSSRRAWIEMSDRSSFCSLASVALLAEGVDRNHTVCRCRCLRGCRPPRGGRG